MAKADGCDQRLTYPHCGQPQGTGQLNPRHTGQIVAVEKTGKGIKMMTILVVLGLAFSIAKLIQHRETPTGSAPWMAAVVLGTVALLVLRLLAWWKHG